MASDGRGPRYRIVGKSAVYLADEIEEWLEKQIVEAPLTSKVRKRGRPKKRASPENVATLFND